MPELPEVETVCRALRPHLLGRRIEAVAVLTARLRHELDAADLRAQVTGRSIEAVRRRGKYLIVALSGGRGLLLHLGMTGAFTVCEPGTPADKHLRVTFTLSDQRSWRFTDPRKFGMLRVCELSSPHADPAELAHKLGPEPLSDAFSAAYLTAGARASTKPIKNLLMEQAFVAGVGNIYASEACFRAGIRPQRRGNRLTRAECARLAAEVKGVLEEAILCGGTTISDFRAPDGSTGRFHVALQVYGRKDQPCLRCGKPHQIQRLVQAGRSSFFCPNCQR